MYLEKNYKEVVEKIENILAAWRWRNLMLSGKITVFKTLANSKVTFLSFLSNVPSSIIQKI